jgi:hypothetical protein
LNIAPILPPPSIYDARRLDARLEFLGERAALGQHDFGCDLNYTLDVL